MKARGIDEVGKLPFKIVFFDILVSLLFMINMIMMQFAKDDDLAWLFCIIKQIILTPIYIDQIYLLRFRLVQV